MKIKSVRLQRFRQFADTTFEVGSFNLLVGANNSGKTTLLHAIRAFFSLMHTHVRFDGNRAVYHRRFLADASEIAPTPDIKELWYQQQTGKPISISVTFDDNKTFSVVMRQQFGQLHISAEALPADLTPAQATQYLGAQVAFIPGLVGVLVTEPFVAGARRNALASQGRYSEIFRSSLFQIKEKDPSVIDRLNESLKSLFNVTVSRISFDSADDEFVTIKYSQNGQDLDVVSSGAGLQQVIQMLTYLYLAKPSILLIDEPDSHLHSKLQAQLGQLFIKVAHDLDAQVFLSTHSLDLIDTFSTNEVLVVDSKKKTLAPIGANSDLVSTLVDAGVVDVSALSRLLSSRKLVIIEDEDQTILKAIDKALGSPMFSSKSSSYVLPAKGSGNFRAIAELGKVLKSLTGTKFDLTFIQDRDGMPDFIVHDFIESQKTDGTAPYLLERHEIENYLLETDLFVAAASLVGRTISGDEARDAILAAANEMRPKARLRARQTAKDVNRHLTSAKKHEESALEVLTDDWFDQLDLSSFEVVQTVFPGKELLKESLKKLNSQGKSITKGHLVASLKSDAVADEMKTLIAALTSD